MSCAFFWAGSQHHPSLGYQDLKISGVLPSLLESINPSKAIHLLWSAVSDPARGFQRFPSSLLSLDMKGGHFQHWPAPGKSCAKFLPKHCKREFFKKVLAVAECCSHYKGIRALGQRDPRQDSWRGNTLESQRKDLDRLESLGSSLLRLPQRIEGSPSRERRGGAGRGGATKNGRAWGHGAGLAGRGRSRSSSKGAWNSGRPLCHRGLRHPLPGAHLPRRPRGSRWGRTRASLGTLGSFPIAFCAPGNLAPRIRPA